MWIVFKTTNLLWLLISTYWWVTADFNQGPIILVIIALMMICLPFLQIKITIDAKLWWIMTAIILIGLWTIYIDGVILGLVTMMMYIPVLFLISLPLNYKEDLLKFTTKWYSILISISLVIYWVSLSITLPSIGTYIHPPYPPFTNLVFYIKTTFDYGTFVRFNAFFLEPGHQAILSTFMIIANQFRFRECPWLWPLALAVIFSFSLAGYILLVAGYSLMKIDTLWKGMAVAVIGTIVVIGAINWSGGENAIYELIVSRMEMDESQGIKGNNRFFNNTDYTYTQAVKNGDLMLGVKNKTNMALIGGAGFKIYIINYGIIGTLLALMLYITLIPNKPDWRYSIGFLIVICMCFIQRAYPAWYSWLFPYVMGIYITKGQLDGKQ